MLPPSRCAPPPRFALPPPPLTLPPPPRRCQAATDVRLSHCRNRRSIRAAAIALLPLRCASPQRFVLPPPPQTLPLPPHRRQAAANVALSRCRHRRSIRAAATVLPPLRCAPSLRFALPPLPLTPPCCRRRRAVALPPPQQPPRCCHRAAAVALCAAVEENHGSYPIIDLSCLH